MVFLGTLGEKERHEGIKIGVEDSKKERQNDRKAH